MEWIRKAVIVVLGTAFCLLSESPDETVHGDISVKPARRVDLVRPAVWNTEGASKTFSVNEARGMKWSPDGKTLAFLEGDATLRTLFPDRSLKLSYTGYYWYQRFSMLWRPDGRRLLVFSEDGTSVVDVVKWREVEIIPRDWIVWWQGNRLAVCRRKSGYMEIPGRSWYVGTKRFELPRGYSVQFVAQDGSVVFGRKETKENFIDSYWRVDHRTGRLKKLWPSRLGEGGIEEEPPAMAWNPRRRLVCLGTILEDRHRAFELGLNQERGVWNLAGEYRWLDDRWLVVPVSLEGGGFDDDLSGLIVKTHWLLLYDAETGQARPVYGSNKMVEAAAVGDKVAILEGKPGNYRIVISEWRRAPDGSILQPLYRPHDETDDAYLAVVAPMANPLPQIASYY